MKTCDTCKWWDNPNGGIQGYCSCLALDAPDSPYGAHISTDSNIAEFFTGSQFGCVQHESEE